MSTLADGRALVRGTVFSAIGLVVVAALWGCEATEPRVAMAVATGEALKAHTREFRREVIEVTDGVHVAVGFGLANSIMIEGQDGLIIVDTMESLEEAREVKRAFRAVSDKPIVALIYTHNHTDHVFGSAAFAEGEGAVEVYAHATTSEHIDRVASVVQPIIRKRSARMFGSHLRGAALQNAGIGPRLALDEHSHLEALRPTKTVDERLDVQIAGVSLQLLHAPGETDDQLMVWLPSKGVLLPGDNLYRAFPNLYTIRGTPYRDVNDWVRSLDRMRALSPRYLVPSHTRPLRGAVRIEGVLRDYRDAIQFVHDQTVRGMNAGLTPDQLVQQVQLPESLSDSPFLQEFYGTVRWSVRSVFDGYLGWFDGNPTTLDPLPPVQHAGRLAKLAGGRTALAKRTSEALATGDYQWTLELTDALLALQPGDRKALLWRATALRELGGAQSNPNARHYYLTAALEAEGLNAGVKGKPTPAMVHSIPMAIIFQAMATRLDAEAAAGDTTAVNFVFPDLQETYSIQLRSSIAEVRPRAVKGAAITLTVDSRIWKEVAAKIRNPATLITEGSAAVDGSVIDLLAFLRYFLPQD